MATLDKEKISEDVLALSLLAPSQEPIKSQSFYLFLAEKNYWIKSLMHMQGAFEVFSVKRL